MSNVSNGNKSHKLRRLRSIYQVHYNIQKREDEMMPKPIAFPTDALEIQAYAMQVAGHKKTEDTKFLGLLQCSNGTILKPIIKEAQKREVDFYKRISLSEDPDLVELRSCTAKYFGCKKFTYNGFEQEYIILEDLTVRMLEPCVMDVKIGKRTWDPLATEEKIKKEKSKYTECKQQYGFCIPGFHVYKHTTGQLHKYNKDYGKRLHGEAVKDAIRKYLNGLGTVLCRALVLQFLSQLWRIQKWARHQLALRLYSTSLLLVYDASRLRECCGETKDPPSRSSPVCWAGAGGAGRRASLGALGASNFSGQLGAHGPLYSRVGAVPTLPLASHAALAAPDAPAPPAAPGPPSPWDDALQRLSVTHSPDHNYDGKLSRIKMNYRATLDQLCSDSPNPNPWGTVKIIDFVHAFFNDEDEREPDDNFREGIDSFVEIFESFLRETDDQVIYA